ncbi:hypothetical protein [Dactylosporangium sp. CA-139066]|uniref:hypothetical protein n=1 Tax=Dactylosporangium sp. CA-139066 TaxID=3239930 RepID=UPI003D8C59FC
MFDERDADVFEASLMLLAGTRRPHLGTGAARGRDVWAVVHAGAAASLRVEFETEEAQVRFTEVMRTVPEATCWTGRRVAGIRRRYETFIVDVGGADPSSVVGRLHGEWTHNVGLLLGDGPLDDMTLWTRAAAVWRSALLTGAPRVSPAGLRLRTRDRSAVRLLVRAARVLGVVCRVRTGQGVQIVHAERPGMISFLATVRPMSEPTACAVGKLAPVRPNRPMRPDRRVPTVPSEGST